jgi:hypothetical protein
MLDRRAHPSAGNLMPPMPLRNRVNPYGEIVAVPERGTLMGNRGVIHGDDGEQVREWQVRRWIACRLEFKGRKRPVRQPRRWTELFFLDEATALAAGHRPCAECRREDYRRWQAAWPGPDTHADAMDRVMHADRLGPRRAARIADLPPGAMVEADGRAWLVTEDGVRPWSFAGYGALSARAGEATVLTPAVTVEAIRNGYAPAIHPTGSADSAGSADSPDSADLAGSAEVRPSEAT